MTLGIGKDSHPAIRLNWTIIAVSLVVSTGLGSIPIALHPTSGHSTITPSPTDRVSSSRSLQRFFPPPRPIPVSGDVGRLADSASPPPGYNGHYYAGGEYWGNVGGASSIQMTLTTPNDSAVAGDFYYVILSIWDNAASYDQIGIASISGNWGLTYAALSNCGTGNNYNPDEVNLLIDMTYTFEMTIHSNGTVFFGVALGPQSDNWIWTLWVYTGGTTFETDAQYYCDGQYWYDYTDYEEIYTLAQQAQPNWSFFFDANIADGNFMMPWKGFTAGSPPSGGSYYPTTHLSVVMLQNE